MPKIVQLVIVGLQLVAQATPPPPPLVPEAVFPEMSEMLAVNRVNELLETGPQIIVTHCPGCIMQLKHGLSELKVKDVEVLDLAQVLAMAMEV